MAGIIAVLLLAQIATGTSQLSPLQRLQAKVQVDPVSEVGARFSGKYSNPPKEAPGGLSGDDLYLLPDGTYIYCEWADIEPLTVRNKGIWNLTDGIIVLTSDADVTWDPGAERKYVAVRRRCRPHEILLVGVGRDLSYFEKSAKDDFETELLVIAKERSQKISHGTSARTKAKLMRDPWRPEYFRTSPH